MQVNRRHFYAPGAEPAGDVVGEVEACGRRSGGPWLVGKHGLIAGVVSELSSEIGGQRDGPRGRDQGLDVAVSMQLELYEAFPRL